MDNYQLIQPSPLLAPYIRQYWFLQADTLAEPAMRIVPDGSISLFFHRRRSMLAVSRNELQPLAFLSGQSVNYSELVQQAAVDMAVVTFQPYGMKAFFEIPANKLFENTVSVDELDEGWIKELADRLMDAEDVSQSVRLIESFFLKRLSLSVIYNYNRVSTVVDAINRGENSLERLAGISCLSYKQFQRVFAEYAGCNPKEFLRIVRFQRTLYVLQQQPQLSFTQLAYECGYYDQSHFIREFKAFSGYTPKEYINAFTPHSDYFS